MSLDSTAEGPVVVHLYKRGRAINEQIEFVIPFFLRNKYTYFLWIYKLLRQIYAKFGHNERSYLLNYLKDTELAREFLQNLPRKDRAIVLGNALEIANKVMVNGVSVFEIEFIESSSLSAHSSKNALDRFRLLHYECTIFTVTEYKDFLNYWSDKFSKQLNSGISRLADFYELIMANCFSNEDIFLFCLIGYGNFDPKEMAEEQFDRMGVTKYDLSQRIIDGNWIARSTFPEKKRLHSDANRIEALTRCSHCNKPNHTENTCWVKHPHLKPQKKGQKRKFQEKKSFIKKAFKKHKLKQEDDKSNQINAVFSLAEPAKTLNLKSPQFPASFGLVPYVNWKKHQSVAFSG